jgi:hypothetical protein
LNPLPPAFPGFLELQGGRKARGSFKIEEETTHTYQAAVEVFPRTPPSRPGGWSARLLKKASPPSMLFLVKASLETNEATLLKISLDRFQDCG